MDRRDFLKVSGAVMCSLGVGGCLEEFSGSNPNRPNIVFVMADDHAANAMSCYGSGLNRTPNLDRLASEGMKFNNCFCTNSICAPSRAAILTGKYSHVNGKMVNLPYEVFDGGQQTFPKLLQAAGYQTAMIGKWHLRSEPTGFDHWDILNVQGEYYDPEFIRMGESERFEGYVTDLITDRCMDWIKGRDKSRPFCLMYHHKAPHREWEPDEKHKKDFAGKIFPVPVNFDDDYSGRCGAASEQTMTIANDMTEADVKGKVPARLSAEEAKRWKYQRYMQDYLACVESIDENMGRFLDFLDEEGLAENTVVVYTSDQGFFLGEHGWFDKRFMYEESLRMPLLVRWPGKIEAGSVNNDIVLNIDLAETFLDIAGAKVPLDMQGESMKGLLLGERQNGWRESMYYHYYEYPSVHDVKRHYGVRTKRYKLIYFYYDIDCWELYDLRKDPDEMNNVYDDPEYAGVVEELKAELVRLQEKYGDSDELARSFLPEEK